MANEPGAGGALETGFLTVGFMRHFGMMLKAGIFAAALAAGATGALAQEAPASEDKTVAVVNGHEIKVSEVQMATDDIIGQLPDLPPKLRYPYVVEYLVERHLMAQMAVKEGVADTDEYKRRLALYQAKALRDAYFFQKVRPMVTEEDIKKAYDDEAAKVAQTERIRARHILVGSEKEANDLEARLKKGEKFEDLAKQYSLDGSKDYGGDLGYFTAAEMVPEFSKAAFALQPGEISPPVKTDYGWHIIKVEDRKMGAAQPYDQVKTAIRNVLLRKKVQELMEVARKSAKIEILDPDLKKAGADAAARAKQLQDPNAQPQDQQAPADGGGDAPADGGDGSGKGDLQIPQQQ
jgi:peptidyl-prolyl cis-trans isomerase C